jgi:NAD(P)-dependent dehydrogenase (short-subunit alcohol dehydrogenase family)
MVFAGKTAIVTGAASGIGRAVTNRLLASGVGVIAADIDQRGLRWAAAAGASVVACNVASASDRRRLSEMATAIDYIVNSAGVVKISPLNEITEDDWDFVMDTNAKATFFLIQALSGRISNGGAIVNIASTAGKTAWTPEMAHYSASKAAVIALTKTFAYAFAPRGIRVNCVCPGEIDTPMTDAVEEGLARARGTKAREATPGLSRIPLSRLGRPEEVASVICFLLSAEASYMTGQSVNISGGLVMY